MKLLLELELLVFCKRVGSAENVLKRLLPIGRFALLQRFSLLR